MKTEHRKKVNTRLVKIVRACFTLAVLLGVIFIPAGTLKWPEAWLFLLLYLVMVTAILAQLSKRNPGLIRERTSTNKQAKSWDKKIMRIYTLLLIALLGIPGLDAVRFRWSEVPLIVKAFGFLGYIPALIFAFWAMLKNAYASNVVRIQEDRGHTVCTTGPYRFIRHPMYAGVILAVISIPLSLGSFYALIPASSIIVLFIIRTALEDKTLQKELPGYMEYAQKVRSRLIPGVW